MNANAGTAASPLLASPFDDPLKNWPNSDLLIAEEDKAFFLRHFPAYAAVFDWPELCSLFVTYNGIAARARRHSRRAGVVAILIGFISLALAAAAPILDESSPDLRVRAVLGGIAAALATVSMLIGYTQILKGKEKTEWLTNRFWTERIRQFHFQLIVNNLEAVVAAAQSDEGARSWRAFRAVELDKFQQDYLRGVEDKIHQMEEDEAEDRPWIFDEWEHQGRIPQDSQELDLLIKILERHRFGIQQRYSERRLTNGWHSPETRAQWVSKLSDSLTAVILLATIVVGIGSVDAVFEHTARPYRLAAGLFAALASSSIVAMRALKEGLLFSTDAERYRWYLAALRTLYRRFEHADTPRKIQLLRELEHVAYQEMRRFILSGKQARFVM
jgi:hypothetical protein